MRKLTFSFAFLLIAVFANAQDNDMDNSMENENSTNLDNYNHWSIELEAGVTKPTRPFTPGYYTSTPDFFQGDLGVRYMFTDLFGLKLDFGYNSFKSGEDKDGSESAYFKSHLMRTSIQGVVNAGSLLHLREWSNTLNFLVHGGLGYATLTPDEADSNLNPNTDDFKDNMLYLTVGLTPQVRLSNSFVLSADITANGNIRQDNTFDGTGKTSVRGVNGFYVDASLGLTYYLGSKDVHADWYNPRKDGSLEDKVDKLRNDVDDIKEDMQDTDRDGVPDYLDEDPNTPAGIAVDSKGRAIDENQNGIPDELEGALDERYEKTSTASSSKYGDSGTIKKLINDGYVNVYFKFNSTQPETYSLQTVNYLIKYMKEDTSANAELIGYADEIGNTDYNQQLSMNRAEKVKQILVASGIDEGRLSVTGGGEDTSVDKSSSTARQIVRRVTFKLK